MYGKLAVCIALVSALGSPLVARDVRAPNRRGFAGQSLLQNQRVARPTWPPQRLDRQRPAVHRPGARRGGRFGDAFMVDTGVVPGPRSGYYYSIGAASNGHGWRVLWADDNGGAVTSAGVGAGGSLADPQGTKAGDFDYMASLQSECIVGTGAGYMAVWPVGDYGIRGAVLDSAGVPVGAPFVIFESDSGEAMPAIAFDGDSTCLVAWTESPNGDPDIYAARVTTSGQVLDPTPILVADDSLAGEQMPSVAFGQGVYLVAWTAATETGSFAEAVRVSTDGAVLNPVVFLLRDPLTMQAYPTVTYGDSCFLAAWSEGLQQPDMCAARISVAGAMIDSAVQLTESPDYDMLASVGFDGDRYLVMWCVYDTLTFASRLSGRRITADGLPLDSSLIRPEFAGFTCMYPSVVADSDNFLVAFSAQDTVSYNTNVGCVRINPDGVVLDSGILLPQGADAQTGPSGASDGADFLAAWLESRAGGSAISAGRISAGGTVLDPVGFPVNVTPGAKGYVTVGYGDSMYMVAWADRRTTDNCILCARVTLDGSVLDPGGILVCADLAGRYWPEVSFDGGNFLVVWQDYRSQIDNDIYAARVSPAGTVLDLNGFAVAVADTFDDQRPAVSFTGTDYLVVWVGMNTNSYVSRVYGALVSPGGQVTKPRFVVGGADNYQDMTSVARGQTNSLVAWQDARTYPEGIYAARVSADGTVLDPNGVRVDSADHTDFSPRVTSGATGFKVVWGYASYNYDSTLVAVAQIDTGGNVVRKQDWFGMPGPDCEFDAVYGSGPELLLLFSCLTDTAQGHSYGSYRMWGRLGDVPGVEEARSAEVLRANSPTIIRGVLFLPQATSRRPQAAGLLDVSGRKVQDLRPGANDVSHLAPGVYFVRRLDVGQTTKVVLAR